MSSKQTSILLIEDNPGDALLVEIYLKDAAFKYQLYRAETFFEGLEVVNKNDIEVVLLDLSLPDSSGFRTLSNFMERAPNLPVVVMTGTNNEIVGNQAVKAGAQDYLVKGQFDGKILGRSIRYSLQRFKAQQLLEDKARDLVIQEKRIVQAHGISRFGNWELDIVTQSFVWTEAIYNIFGFQPGSFNPMLSDYLSYVSSEDKEAVEQFFDDAAKDGKLHKIEHKIVLNGQKVKYVSLHAQIAFEELSNKFLLVGGLQDVTERKMAEEEMIEKNMNNRSLQLKEEVIANLGFHIRTPLSSVVNLIYLLNNTHLSPQQSELMDGLKVSVEDLSLTVNNLLNFSLLVAQNIKVTADEFNLQDYLQSIKKVLRIKTENAHLKFDFILGNDLPEKICCDYEKMTQIIYNMIDNALRHTQDKGKITLSVQHKNQNELKGSLILEVAYTGKNINPVFLKEIENPDKFLAGDMDDLKKQQINLAIVAKLAKTLGGKTTFVNRENMGTICQVEIPFNVIAKRPGKLLDAPIAPLRILLVEDHFLNQMATRKLLTSWSPLVTVDVAENGLVAVEKFRAYGYDLILMDIQMPVMDGFDATIRIKQTDQQVPILALTANATKAEAEKCRASGMDGYLAKPFKPQELYELIMNNIAV